MGGLDVSAFCISALSWKRTGLAGTDQGKRMNIRPHNGVKPRSLIEEVTMKASVCFLAMVILFCRPPISTADPWALTVDANLTLAQTAYSNNWVGGEAGNVTWALSSIWLAEKRLQPLVHNKNTLKLSFGQTHSQDVDSKDWARPTKSTDLIDFETIFNLTLGGFVDPFAAGRWESQFLDASDPEKDRYVNPLKFTESLGIIRYLMKEGGREWSIRLGGAFRQFVDRDVFVDADQGLRETQTSNDGGIEFVSELKSPLAGEKISVSNKLIAFQALFYSKSDELKGQPNEDYWKSPDINWENILTIGVTKYLMVNLYNQLLYDKEVNKGGRFKQTLSLGFTYRLG
jgi:hypothetical protein